MNEYKKYLLAGLGLIMVSTLLRSFDFLPHAVQGFCSGLGIVLLLISAYAYRHDMVKGRSAKGNFIKRFLGK